MVRARNTTRNIAEHRTTGTRNGVPVVKSTPPRKTSAKKKDISSLNQSDLSETLFSDVRECNHGVPNLSDETFENARRNLCASDYVQKLPEETQVDDTFLLMQMLGIDPASQLYGKRQTVGPGQVFTDQTPERISNRGFHTS